MPRRKQPLRSTKGLATGRPPQRQARPRPQDRAGHAAADVRAIVFDRDQHCRLRGASVGPCFGVLLTPHHLHKSGQQGLYVPRNLITLCGWHNDWVEVDKALATAWGLYVSPWADGTDPDAYHGTAWARMHLAGLVDYWWDGTPADDPCPDLLAAA